MVEERKISTTSLKRKPTDTEVMISTGVSNQPHIGRLSGVASFSKWSGSQKFQELWKVRIQSGALGML